MIRVYKNAWFAKFASKEKIDARLLCEAIERAENGLIDADLGSGLFKQRIAREGAGKSGGYRTFVFFRSGERAIFAYGFAKSDRANLTRDELEEFKRAAKFALAFTQSEIDALVQNGKLEEIEHGNEDL
jgi:hypothetical protein